MFALLFITVWCIGAAVTLKADFMFANCPTYWWDYPLSLICWPAIAVLICRTKHKCGKEYHY
jgi:hypothetical protein